MGILELGTLLAGGRRRRELYRQGMAGFNRGDYRAAVAALGGIDDEDSLHGRLARFYLGHAHCQLGLAALAEGDHPGAIGQFQSACRYNPAGGDLARYLAVAFVRAGQLDMAARPLERALSGDRADTRARVMLAQVQWRTGQPDRAELTLHEGLGARGEPADVNFHLALLAAQSDRWAEAEGRLARAVAADESDAQAWRYLGLACGAQDKPAAAVEHLRKAQRLAPTDPQIALELAYAASAAEATAIAPRRVLANLAARPVQRHADLDRLARAILAEPEFIQAFLDLEPSPMDQEIFGVLGLSLERAVQRRPHYADLHYYVSRAHERLGQIGPAIDSAEQALQINPRYVAALIQAAELYRRTADRGAACERLRAAVSAGGDYPDVHLLLGHIHREMGQVAQARESYQRALTLRPGLPAAREALDALAA